MKYLPFAIVCLLWLPATMHAAGGFRFEAIDYREDFDAIVLATIEHPRKIEGDDGEGLFGKHWQAWTLTLQIEEVLRGKDPGTTVDIPRVAIGATEITRIPDRPYAFRKTEVTAAHLEAQKLIAFLGRDPKTGKRTMLRMVVPDFECQEVRIWRRVGAYLDLSGPDERLAALRAGINGKEPGFQFFCCGELDRVSRLDAEEAILSRQEAMGVICTRFLDDDTPIEVLLECYRILAGHCGPGWVTHPMCYDVLHRAVSSENSEEPVERLLLSSGIVGFRRTDGEELSLAACALASFPERRRETFELLQKTVRKGPKIGGGRLLYEVRRLYEPLTVNEEQERLNEDIFQLLVDVLDGDDEYLADWAALALNGIAWQYARQGPIPSRLTDLYAGNGRELSEKALRILHIRLDLKEIAADKVVLECRKEAEKGLKEVVVPSKRWGGDEVMAVGDAGLLTETPQGWAFFGLPIYGGNHRQSALWIEPCPPWLQRLQRAGGQILCTGRISKREDLPVFEWTPGEPFKAGLPIPPGYDAERIRTRYLLSNAEFRLVSK